jgi:hypothetical protein
VTESRDAVSDEAMAEHVARGRADPESASVIIHARAHFAAGGAREDCPFEDPRARGRWLWMFTLAAEAAAEKHAKERAQMALQERMGLR